MLDECRRECRLLALPLVLAVVRSSPLPLLLLLQLPPLALVLPDRRRLPCSSALRVCMERSLFREEEEEEEGGLVAELVDARFASTDRDEEEAPSSSVASASAGEEA